MFRYLIVFGFFAIMGTCSQKVNKQYLTEIVLPVEGQTPASYEGKSPCKIKENYMPDIKHVDHTPLKVIRLNFHIMNGGRGTANFNERKGTAFIKEVMDVANKKLKRNKQMRLPIGNNTPIIPMRYRYELTGRPGDPDDDGIYFHNDDACYAQINTGKGKNIYDKTPFERYGVMKDTVMNIFVMPYPEDSLTSKTFRKSSNGIAFGNWLKVCGWHYNATKDTIWRNGKWEVPYGKWFAAKLLHHEVGHNLGLRHTWNSNDGCDDTPKHPNCYGHTPNRSPCDSLWSNNFMDYNTHISAWSPCQIATIHHNMSPGKKPKLRDMLVPTWCDFKKEATINIKDDIVWSSAKDLEGNLVIKNGASLTVRCMVSLPKGAKIEVHPKGKLILNGATLYNDCGEKWQGIEILSTKSRTGTVAYFGASEIKDVEREVKVIVEE